MTQKVRTVLSRVAAVAGIALMLLISFAGVSFAAGEAAGDDQSLLELAKPVLDAIVHGQYWIGAAAGVVLAVALARKYVPKDSRPGKLLASELGGMVCAALIAFGGAMTNSLVALGIKVPTAAVFTTAGKVAFAAVGGWMILHKLATVATATKWYQDKAPAWLKAVVAFVLAMIGSNAATKAEATKAGEDAVKADPPKGAEGIVAKPEEF